jgi:uncharacterized protein YhaN
MANSAPSEHNDTRKDRAHSESRREAIQKWFEANWAQVLFFIGGLALYLLLGLFLWWLLQRYVDPSAIKDPSKEATAKKDLLQALGLIMAGVAGAVGIFFTWRGQTQAREAQEVNQKNTLAQLENARKQLELAQRSQEKYQENTQAQMEQSRNELAVSSEGQITDRFTKAIEQIGASSNKGKNLEMRLGGIHALERISRESENDYWPIMEILSAYVREHAPRDPAAGADFDEGAAEAVLDKGVAKRVVLERLPFRHAEADIQAILDTIGRRSRRYMKEEGQLRIRLDKTDLRGATFFRANLTGVWFWEADLRGAYFGECDLTGAVFSKANLEHTVFEKVDLQVVYGLSREQIEQAFGYETELPNYLSKPAHWD